MLVLERNGRRNPNSLEVQVWNFGRHAAMKHAYATHTCISKGLVPQGDLSLHARPITNMQKRDDF